MGNLSKKPKTPSNTMKHIIKKTITKCLKEDAEEVPDILYHGTDKKFNTFNDDKPILFV